MISDVLQKTLDISKSTPINLLIASSAIVKIIRPRSALIKEISQNLRDSRVIALGDKSTTKNKKNTRIAIKGPLASKLSVISSLFDLVDEILKKIGL